MAYYLITGGTGSFGRAFIKTILRDEPASRIVSISRNAEMRYRLEADFPDPRLTVIPGDVRSASDLDQCVRFPLDTVIHCAAEKHVPTGQKFCAYTQAINVHGAANVIALAQRVGARVLALSTDKSCLPQTFYGETKAEAERLFIRAGYSVVRYGNVVGSSGSVIPLFLKQREHGRLTVTDVRCTRFWMPISDDADVQVFQEPGQQPVMSAVRWVRLALEHMRGGEIFVPEIPSASVIDVAKAVGPDCEIVETGLRAGEKIHEDLISLDEGTRAIRIHWGGWAIIQHNVETFGSSGFFYRSDQGLQPVRLERAS